VDGRARRELRDPHALRALAHPFRLRLLDLVEAHGTLTTKQASEATGESTASCSFHLRQLAKYGFLERAEAGDRRERPWRRVSGGERVPDSADASLNRAAAEASKVFVDRLADEAGAWLDGRTALPPSWRAAATFDDELLYLTAPELRSLARAVVDLLAEHRARTGDPSLRPKGARPVRAAALLFPIDE